MATYVCSDIHGRYDRFIKLLECINFNENDKLYILGDVIDRGEDGICILKYIMKHSENICLLMGNHEFMMLDYLDNEKKWDESECNYNIWLDERNGGRITLENFKKETEETQKEIYEFLTDLPVIAILEINGQKFHLSHSGTVNSEDLDTTKEKLWHTNDFTKRDVFYIVWGSPYRLDTYVPESQYPENCICINGHVPVQSIYGDKKNFMICENEIIDLLTIDGGCAMSAIEKKYPNEIQTALIGFCLDDFASYYITL